MVSNGMSEDEVDMHGSQRFQRVAVVRREPITVDLVADESDREENDSVSDEDGNLEDMPDLISLPPGPVLKYYDNDERPRAQYKYRELAEYQPIIPVRIPRRDVVRTELRPYIFRSHIELEDMYRATCTVRAHMVGNPHRGCVQYQVNQVAAARMRTEELYLKAFCDEYGMYSCPRDTDRIESNKNVLRKCYWHMASERAWQEAACSGPNTMLSRKCLEKSRRIQAASNMDGHGKYIDERSDGVEVCIDEKMMTAGHNLTRLTEHIDQDGAPIQNNRFFESFSDYGVPFELDTQRGLASYLNTATRTPENRLRKSIVAMGTDGFHRQAAMDKYAVYADSCASNSVVKYKEMLIPDTFVEYRGEITGSTTENPIAIIGRGLMCFMGR